MSFLYPSFLFGLSLIAVPIVIHYFNLQKAKRIYFTNVAFLKTIKDVTNARNRLKHLLILLTRICFIIFLCMAFAQPYIPKKNNAHLANATPYVSIYLDNSYSLQAEYGEKRLYDIAQNIVKQIVHLFPSHALFQLIDNRFEESVFFFMEGEKVIDKANEIPFCNTSRTFEEIYQRQTEAFNANNLSNNARYVFWISDFQKSTSGNMNKIPLDSTHQIHLLPLLPNQTANLYIDSVWLSEPFVKEIENNTLHIKIANESNEAIKSRNLQFFMDGKLVASTTVHLPAQSYQTVQLNFSTEERGIKKCRLQLEDFTVSFDDEYYFLLNVAPTIRITLIGNNPSLHYLEEVFKGESFFKVEKYSFQSIDFNALKETDLLIIEGLTALDEALKSSLTEIFLKGKYVVVFPSTDIDELGMGSFFNLSINKTKENTALSADYLSFKHPFFEKILDKIEPTMSVPQGIAVIDWKTSGQTLITFKNDRPFLSMIPQRKGKLFLFAFPLNDNFTDLHKHALFLPILYRISLSSPSSETRLAYSFGESTAIIALDSMKRNDIFVMSGNNNEWIPQQRIIGNTLQITIPKGTLPAGIYALKRNQQPQIVGHMALNYDKRESQLSYYSLSELKTFFEGKKNVQFFQPNEEDSFAKHYQEQNFQTNLWRWFIALALLALLAETLLIRFWKTT